MMKKSAWVFVFICVALAVAAVGCIDNAGTTPDNGNNNTTPGNGSNDTAPGNGTNNTALEDELNHISNLADELLIVPVDSSPSIPRSSLTNLRNQMEISDDRQSIMFVFDEAANGDRWELTMEPKNLLTLTTDRIIVPEEGETESSLNLHVWVLETGEESGTMVMNYKYVTGDTDKIINTIYYVIRINENGNISITNRYQQFIV
ncbi:MAG: hypothetical protein LBU81_05655 [Methanosarcinales archaeon]|jgi:hypothetical protein|nr:hypothetical protein [Methanosarcinales archaeon]